MITDCFDIFSEIDIDWFWPILFLFGVFAIGIIVKNVDSREKDDT